MDLEKKPEIKQSLGGVSVVREAKSVDLRVPLHLSLESRGCYYHFSGLRFGTVNLFAEETALGST